MSRGPVVTPNGSERSNASEDRIELVDPDPSWRGQYEQEAAALRSVVASADDLHFEHFGSTAVPNLRAKPIIDILLIHPAVDLWPQLIAPICGLGYVYWAENPRKDQMLFVKGMPPFGPRRTHHVHVRVPHDAKREVVFRDLLRSDPLLVRRYQLLKESLAQRYPTNREAYTDGKAAFIEEILQAAVRRR